MSDDGRKRHNSKNGVPELLCEARMETADEKLNGLKKTIYAAFAVSMAWLTILELIFRYV